MIFWPTSSNNGQLCNSHFDCRSIQQFTQWTVSVTTALPATIFIFSSPAWSICVFLVQFQEENLWQKKREDELHRTMTQLNLLDKRKNAFTKKDMLSSQQQMVSCPVCLSAVLQLANNILNSYNGLFSLVSF